MGIIRSFRELDVCVLAREQAKRIFTITKSFPPDERFSLTDQIRRSSRAVNAMVVEAWARRRYQAAFIHKPYEAMGEGMETQAWLDHSLACDYINEQVHQEMDDKWQHAGAMLHRMIDRADRFCTRKGP